MDKYKLNNYYYAYIIHDKLEWINNFNEFVKANGYLEECEYCSTIRECIDRAMLHLGNKSKYSKDTYYLYVALLLEVKSKPSCEVFCTARCLDKNFNPIDTKKFTYDENFCEISIFEINHSKRQVIIKK